PIHLGMIRVSLTSPPDGRNAVCLKSDNGGIHLSDGSKAKRLHIWNDPGLPSVVEHRVDCRDGQLKVWNIYRVLHPEGATTEDSWTGNAGMILRQEGSQKRSYRCSDGIGEFDPNDFTFTVEWKGE